MCPSILGGVGGGAHLHHPQNVSLYLGCWGRGSFASSTECVPLSWVEMGEGLICIIHRMCPSILGGNGRGAHLHHPQSVSLHLVWWWGWGSLASSTECVPLSSLVVGGGGAHLHHPQGVSLSLSWVVVVVGGSFASSTGCVPLSWVVVGEGLICIIHRMCPSILGVGGGGAHLHHPQSVSLSLFWVVVREGGHLHHPQGVSLYLGWWWRRGSSASSTECVHLSILGGGEGGWAFASSTGCVPLSWVVVGGGAHLHHPQGVSLYLGWWWGRGSLASSTECVSLSILGGGGGGAHLHHPQGVSLYLGWWWGRGSLASSTECVPLSWVEVGEGLTCIIHRVCPSILGGGGGGAHSHHPRNVSLYLGWRWGRGSFA